ncbi:protein phosphatase 1 regulatory subunit 12A-like [Oscarella lobularis]|uniref:protein phosphatase 1 regulatory subunit 12A-like n=1 Tax=Oscarella lobularis TaxID=121494 RepID=UPI0033133EDC
MLKPKRAPSASMPCMDQALSEAVLENDLSQVRQALRAGAAVNRLDREGLAPIHQAIYEDNFDIVRLLVRNGADVRLRDDEGSTPLHAVAQTGNCEMACYLLKTGANTDAVDGNGLFPIDHAETNEMCSLLYRAMKRAGHVQLANRYKAFQEQESLYGPAGTSLGETDSIGSTVSAHSYLTSEDDENQEEDFAVLVPSLSSSSSSPENDDRGAPCTCKQMAGDNVVDSGGRNADRSGGGATKRDDEESTAVLNKEHCQQEIRKPCLSSLNGRGGGFARGFVGDGDEDEDEDQVEGSVPVAKERSQLKVARAAFFSKFSPVPRRRRAIGRGVGTFDDGHSRRRRENGSSTPDRILDESNERTRSDVGAEEKKKALCKENTEVEEEGKATFPGDERAPMETSSCAVGVTPPVSTVTDLGDWDSFSENDDDDDDDVIFFSLASTTSTKTAVLKSSGINEKRTSITSLFSPDSDGSPMPPPPPMSPPTGAATIISSDESSDDDDDGDVKVNVLDCSNKRELPPSPVLPSFRPKSLFRSASSDSNTNEPRLKSLLKLGRSQSTKTRSPVRQVDAVSPRRRSVCFAPEVCFQSAVVDGDLAEMRSMIRSNSIDVNSFTPQGYAPLHAAALEGNVDCIAVLLDSGSLVNLRDESGWTALHAAASQGHSNAVRYLLERGADSCITGLKGETAYHVVAEGESMEVLRRVLSESMGSRFGELEKGVFAEESDEEEDEENEGEDASGERQHSGDEEEEEEASEEECEKQVEEEEEEEEAEEETSSEELDPSFPSEDCTNNLRVDTPSVSDLPPSPKTVTFTPSVLLQQAVIDEDVREVEKLLTQYSSDELDVNRPVYASGTTSLHESVNAENCSIDLVRLLVEKGGADLHIADADGWTALHNASAIGSVDVARYLIRQGAKVSVLNKKGQFPLEVADSQEMIVLLKNAMLGKGVL